MLKSGFFLALVCGFFSLNACDALLASELSDVESSINEIEIRQINEVDIKAIYYSPVDHVMLTRPDFSARMRVIFLTHEYTSDFSGDYIPIAIVILHRNHVQSEPRGFEIGSTKEGNFGVRSAITGDMRDGVFKLDVYQRDCVECTSVRYNIHMNGDDFSFEVVE